MARPADFTRCRPPRWQRLHFIATTIEGLRAVPPTWMHVGDTCSANPAGGEQAFFWRCMGKHAQIELTVRELAVWTFCGVRWAAVEPWTFEASAYHMAKADQVVDLQRRGR